MNYRSYEYLRNNDQLLKFVRYNPLWYRYLSRDPSAIKLMEKEAKVFYGKTLSQRLERMSDQIQLVSMLIHFSEAMKD